MNDQHRSRDAERTLRAIAEIRGWLRSRAGELLEMRAGEINPHEPLADYGLDSISAAELAADLEDWLGHESAFPSAWQELTIETVAQHAAAALGASGRTKRASQSRKTRLSTNGSRSLP